MRMSLRRTAMAVILLILGTDTSANGRMINNTDKAPTLMPMDGLMKEYGRMVYIINLGGSFGIRPSTP